MDQSVTVQRVNIEDSVQISVYQFHEYDAESAFMLNLFFKDEAIRARKQKACADVLFCETRRLVSPDPQVTNGAVALKCGSSARWLFNSSFIYLVLFEFQ